MVGRSALKPYDECHHLFSQYLLSISIPRHNAIPCPQVAHSYLNLYITQLTPLA